MSLQGSLDGFPLPDVLALLASTKKRGELRVAGHHGAGRVWVADGAIVGVEAGGARGLVDALFHLLRVETGTFTFDSAASVPDGKPAELEPLLAEAHNRLAEWRTIEAVVPSLSARIDLAEELPSPKVTITAAHWRVLRTVAVGATVEDVAKVLGADEFAACQVVKRLVDHGLVTVGEEGPHRPTRAPATLDVREPDAAEPDDHEEDHEEDHTAVPSGPDPDELVTIPAHLRRARRTPVLEPPARRSRLSEAAARLRAENGQSEPGGSGDLVEAAAAALTPENADALVRELAALGTDVSEAAEAIEAASRATTTEERAAVLEGVLTNDQGEPLNRALLLKFLSSVRT